MAKKKLTATRITELREKLLPQALLIVTQDVVGPARLTEPQHLEIARRALALAHAVAVSAVGWEQILAKQQHDEHVLMKSYKANMKRYLEMFEGIPIDDAGALAATLKGGTP